jgi:hypothetical protein
VVIITLRIAASSASIRGSGSIVDRLPFAPIPRPEMAGGRERRMLSLRYITCDLVTGGHATVSRWVGGNPELPAPRNIARLLRCKRSSALPVPMQAGIIFGGSFDGGEVRDWPEPRDFPRFTSPTRVLLRRHERSRHFANVLDEKPDQRAQHAVSKRQYRNRVPINLQINRQNFQTELGGIEA